MENTTLGRCIAIINGITYNLRRIIVTPNHPNGGQFYVLAAIQTDYPYEVHEKDATTIKSILYTLLGATDTDYADRDKLPKLLQRATIIMWNAQEDAEHFYGKTYKGDAHDLISLYRFMHQYMYVAKLQIMWLYTYIKQQSILDDAASLPLGEFVDKHHYRAKRLAAIACEERGLKSTYDLYNDVRQLKQYANNL